MNWEAIGAIGEIIGALSVVLSLIYLASQIRISNRNARRAANQELTDQSFRAYHMLAESDELSELWIRGIQGDETLKEKELLRFRAALTPVVLTWQRYYYLGLQDEADSAMVDGMAFVRKQAVGSPGFRSWFKERRNQLGEEFRTELEKEMAAAGSEYNPIGVSLDSANEKPGGEAPGEPGGKAGL